jgi:TctA family transporter
MGAIPGLTATMAVALLVPITFFLNDTTALAAIVTLSVCAIFAGDIPTTILRIPGTPSSAAFVDDSYSMTRQGKHLRALGISLVFSVAGGLLGAVILFLFAPQLARFAFQFTSYEYFWLTLLGLSCAAVVSSGSLLKGTIALLIGLLLSMVGLSEVHSIPRFTFGRDDLIAGIDFIPAMIGLFGFSEVLRGTFTGGDSPQPGEARAIPYYSAKPTSVLHRHLFHPFRLILSRPVVFFWRRKLESVRSTLVGFGVGMLPGAGADIGAWISYAVSKRSSSHPEKYGYGSEEGIADATCANNAALAGAWVPALVFGIPGDSVTAIVIGVLLMKNITPGPQIFMDETQSVLVYGIFLSFVLANLILLPAGFLAIRTGSLLVRVPKRILLPIILLFCLVGSYAINGSYFDVWVMLAMGILGFVLESGRFPLGPVVLGIILGGRLEQTFIQSVSKSQSYLDFFSRPVAAALGIACLLMWLAPLIRATARRRSGTDSQ